MLSPNTSTNNCYIKKYLKKKKYMKYALFMYLDIQIIEIVS